MNILVTEFDDTDVMIFTESLTPEEVEGKLKAKGLSFGEVYEVPDADVQFYIYEPCWIN